MRDEPEDFATWSTKRLHPLHFVADAIRVLDLQCRRVETPEHQDLCVEAKSLPEHSERAHRRVTKRDVDRLGRRKLSKWFPWQPHNANIDSERRSILDPVRLRKQRQPSQGLGPQRVSSDQHFRALSPPRSGLVAAARISGAANDSERSVGEPLDLMVV